MKVSVKKNMLLLILEVIIIAPILYTVTILMELRI